MVKKRKQKVSKKFIPQASIVSDELYLPNHSGQLDAGTFKLTDGSVLFAENNKIAQDNFNLFWDSTRKELQPNLIKITSDGSQAAPALKFNDTNTGFFKSGDSIRLSLNNSTKMTIDSTGVGIGTASPATVLHINDGTTTDQLRITHGEVFGYKIGRNTGTGLLEFRGTQAGFTGYVFRNDDGSADLSILDSGNVGIGTLNPLLKLDVRGRIKAVATASGTPPFVAYATDGTTINALLGSWDSDNSALNLKDSSQANKVLLSSKANAVSYINNGGNVGIGTATPTTQFSVKEKSGMSPIGGICIRLTNKTGGNTVAGQLVAVYTTTAVDDAFVTCSASDDNVIGIVLDAGVSDGSEAWIVVSGIADVLIDAGGSARGDRMISSATAGSADVWNVGGAVATHFLEIGHCIETRAGAGLARCVLHFN